ncbi:MAG TPA: UDP-N-acetylmuramate dehydrogenase [Verrucomicrobiota bacterium]|nr:UDP-N-acetylmuramate dehydrogenase [Verrucomicrobiota bacterium]
MILKLLFWVRMGEAVDVGQLHIMASHRDCGGSGGADGVAGAHLAGAAKRVASPFESAGLSAWSVVRANEPMSRLTTLRVGGTADWYVEPGTEEDVGVIVRCCVARGLPLLVIGHGSNLLVRDGGIRGVVMALRGPAFCRVAVEGTTVLCGSGAALRFVARAACDAGVSGFEFMDGIPGTVGGALRMNAGAFGGSTFGVLQRAKYMEKDGTVREGAAEEFGAQYRGCEFFKDKVVLGAVFKGVVDTCAAIRERMEEMRRRRLAMQPREWSAGCVFKNTSAGAAGWLIDRAGLKGFKVGKAAVSGVHANFLINEGGASAAEMIELIDRVREKVKETLGVELETEIEIVGEDA